MTTFNLIQKTFDIDNFTHTHTQTWKVLKFYSLIVKRTLIEAFQSWTVILKIYMMSYEESSSKLLIKET